MYNCFLSILLISISFGSVAATWGVKTKITGYYTYANGGSFINVAQKENPDNCTNGAYLALDTNAANFNAIYSTVMTAYTSQQTVTLYYNGCLGTFPKIDSVAVPELW